MPQTDSTDQISGEWNVSFSVHGETTPGNFKLRLDGNADNWDGLRSPPYLEPSARQSGVALKYRFTKTLCTRA